ncbi:MAG: formyltransferase family protein, partial [Microgenomates group bacterium]
TSLGALPKTMKQFNSVRTGLILDFNKIIPNETINLFPQGIINIHFSKLPQYRGPAPVQYTILNGDKQAWITYYLINEKVDAGKILKQTSLDLDFTETTESLYQKLILKSAREINGIIEDYLQGKILPFPQKALLPPLAN